jgi:ubiquinone/menaquinone biosynthesis C-methylase UbiE
VQRKVNIGTRHWIGPDWFHIDIDVTPLVGPDGSLHPVDLVCDATKIPLPDGCADHIHSSEALEHFSWRRTGDVVKEWARLLAPGGTMRIEVPDGCAAAQQLLATETVENHIAMQQILLAEQSSPYDIHLALLTHLTLPHFVQASGLTVTNLERGFDCGWLRCDGVKR